MGDADGRYLFLCEISSQVRFEDDSQDSSKNFPFNRAVSSGRLTSREDPVNWTKVSVLILSLAWA